MKIGNRVIDQNSPAFIVAELSANHLQKFDKAIETVHAIKKTGADAVKIQTYTADTITLKCNNKYFQISGGTLWDGKTLYELYQEAFTPWEWQLDLKKEAEKCGLLFFSSPFDTTSVDFLEQLNMPAYKVASFEITDIPLIEYIASKQKPVIISTGIAHLPEIEEAVQACRRVGNNDIVLLKCTSAYPAPVEELNLLTMTDLAKRFGVLVGLSDHTLSPSVPVAAVALGAKIIERHFILDRKMGGPDAAFSMEPAEFEQMVKAVRETESALGRVTYDLSERIQKSRLFTRSLFAVEDIQTGEEFTLKNIRSVRPGHGLPPKRLKSILGKKALRFVERGTPLDEKMFG